MDLNGLIHDFSSMVASQQEQVDRIEDNIERTSENVNQGSKHLVLVRTGGLTVPECTFCPF